MDGLRIHEHATTRRLSWGGIDLEEALRRLHAEHPEADQATLRGLFLDYLDGLTTALWDECRRQCGAVFFDARFRYAIGRPARAKRTTERRARVETAKRNILRGIFELVMPNDKQLGDCTRADLVRLGGQCGRLVEHMPRGKKRLRDVMSQEEVQRLWSRG
jgi:hypothetical protein